MNDFQARFGWFWYNDEEIFHDTQSDLDAKLAKMADMGITHVITFSCTHFRWSFRPWWPQINECLAKVVQAARKVNIKVIEHHSAHFSFYPGSENRDELENDLKLRRSSLESWPGIVEYLLRPDAEEEKWVQIDGRTGKPLIAYKSHAKCFNNPDYRKEYFKYLESVYACGVDGIMTDDVQYFALGNACACPCCRKLFKEQSGYDLPPPEGWKEWFGDMHDPGFLAYLQFRFASTERFHLAVKEHYERLHLRLLRPNYTSSGLNSNLSAYVAEKLPALDWFFQECCFSSVIRYSWPCFLLEQHHRAMVAGERKIPHMMMFYADREDSLVFTWGLAMLSGSLYTNTPEGKSTLNEKRLRDFEKRYSEDLTEASPLPSAGFIDSLKNRRYGASYDASRLKFWMQSCQLENIPLTLLNIEAPETWKTPVVVLNEVHLISDAEGAALRRYAENGGILVVTGLSGNQQGNGRVRTAEELDTLWTLSGGTGKILRIKDGFGYPGTEEEKHWLFIDYPNRFRYDSLLELLPKKKEFRDYWIPRGIQLDPSPKLNEPDKFYRENTAARRETAAFLRTLAGEKLTLRTENVPELVLAVPWISKNRQSITLRLLNAAQTFDRLPEDKLAHTDKIPFPALKGPNFIFELLLPEDFEGTGEVSFMDLENQAQKLSAEHSGHTLKVKLPSSRLRDFGMIRISRK